MDEAVNPHINPNFNPNKSELWNLSFRDLFYKYVRFLPFFVISIAIALLAAFLYLRWAVPVYSATGSMIIKNDQEGRSGDKFDELFTSNRNQNIQSEIEILKSRPLMQRVVKALNLEFSYYAIGKIKTVNIYKQGPFLIRAIKINDSSATFTFKIKFISDASFRINEDAKVFHYGDKIENVYGEFEFLKNYGLPGATSYSVTWQPTVAAAGVYAGALQILPKTPGTGILNISMRVPNAQLGSDIINELMSEYSSYSVEQKKLSSDQTLAFIDTNLVDIGSKLDTAQKHLLNYQTKFNLIDPDAQTNNYFEIISEADKGVNEQNLKLTIAGMLDNYLADKKNEFTKMVVPSSLGIVDATLNELVSSYNKAQIERKSLVESYVPVDNPSVKELDAQIEKLRASIRENLRNISQASSESANRLSKRGTVSEEQLRAMPEKVKELSEIKRRVETFQSLFKLFNEKKVETSITRASTISNSEIIDRSYVNQSPVSPNKRSIQLMAVFNSFCF